MNNKNVFDKMDDWVNGTEGSIVNFLTAFAPWLAPLAPAYMTFLHMQDYLQFPFIISLALAILVEILGFGTVSTALDFWFHNRKEKAGMKRAPLEVVIGVFIFYLVLILVSNVVIDVSVAYLTEGWQKLAVIIVKALLTLQTIPGALIVAVRTGHRGLLQQIKKEKDEETYRKLTEKSKNSGGESEEVSQNFPKDWRTLRPTLTNEQVVYFANLDSLKVKEVAKKAGVDERTVVNWRKYAKKELGQNENA